MRIGSQGSHTSNRKVICLVTICWLITPILASSANHRPRNLFLADANMAMSYNEAAQQDMVPQFGPRGPSRRLSESDIDYLHTGPGHFGNLMTGINADGNRVYWGNGIVWIVKRDFDNYKGSTITFSGQRIASSPMAMLLIGTTTISRSGN